MRSCAFSPPSTPMRNSSIVSSARTGPARTVDATKAAISFFMVFTLSDWGCTRAPMHTGSGYSNRGLGFAQGAELATIECFDACRGAVLAETRVGTVDVAR